MKIPPYVVAAWIMFALMAIIAWQERRSPITLMTPCGMGEIVVSGPDGLPKCVKPPDTTR